MGRVAGHTAATIQARVFGRARTTIEVAPRRRVCGLELLKGDARLACFYESDSLTVARADKDSGLLLATTAGCSHASVLTRLLKKSALAPAIQTSVAVDWNRRLNQLESLRGERSGVDC